MTASPGRIEHGPLDARDLLPSGAAVCYGRAMAGNDEARARAPWAAGDWDSFSSLIAPVGKVLLDRIGLEAGLELLDVGTGSGGTIAIPAALRGAKVTGVDITTELFEHGRRRAAEAGVEIEWIEGDAAELPFAEGSFDRVTSTFGAMFAPDHAKAASELVRVCRPGGRLGMTTWTLNGMAGELFQLTGRFLPPPPPGAQVPPQWGDEAHIHEMFGAAGLEVTVTQETVEFEYPSVEAMVEAYTTDFGVFVVAREILEPQGRWDEFVSDFSALVARHNRAGDGTARIGSDYLLILGER